MINQYVFPSPIEMGEENTFRVLLFSLGPPTSSKQLFLPHIRSNSAFLLAALKSLALTDGRGKDLSPREIRVRERMGAKMGYKPRKRLCSKRRRPAIPIGRLHALPFEGDSPNSATGKLWNLACIQGLVVANLALLANPGRANKQQSSLPLFTPSSSPYPPLASSPSSVVLKLYRADPKSPHSPTRDILQGRSLVPPLSRLFPSPNSYGSRSLIYISSSLRASLCTVLCTVYVSYRGCGATRIAPLRK